MSMDRFISGLQLPNVTAGTTVRASDSADFFRIYFKTDNLYATDETGTETQLTGLNSIDLNGLTAATVDVANDSIAIIDANDGNASRKESIADLVSAIAGTNLTATNGVLSASGGGGGGGVTAATIYVATISTAQSVNTTSTVAWNNVLVSDSNFSNASGVITVSAAGKYRVYAALSMTGSVARSNIRVRIGINGTTAGSASGQSGYIRAASGHNESTVYVEDVFDLSANDTIRILSQREAAAGTVTLLSNQSRLIIEKVEIGTGAAAGHTSTTGKTLTTADMNTTINSTGNITVASTSASAAGDIVVVHNNSGSNISIVDGTITTMRLAGSATTGTRTVAQRGVAFLYFASTSEVIVGGSGVS
jgi:hypothetical protein